MQALSIHPSLASVLKNPSAVYRPYKLVEQKTAQDAQDQIVKDLHRDKERTLIFGVEGKSPVTLHELFSNYIKNKHGDDKLSEKLQDKGIFEEFMKVQLQKMGKTIGSHMKSNPNLNGLNIKFKSGSDPHENAALYMTYLLTQEILQPPTEDLVLRNVGKAVKFPLHWSVLDLGNFRIRRYGIAEIKDPNGEMNSSLSPDLMQVNIDCNQIEKCTQGTYSFHTLSQGK